ncbi:hypothetical protein SteCoe_25659 [Stentor coeruleus]|uniref:Uncharacterized protein n=1 Tax=Stentor coeruleus TaxID=5963 RepID=A0A1R2BEQ3_9CILI|nr:hypothetical protein SteCoe_25659 [Stentor coeruleus]
MIKNPKQTAKKIQLSPSPIAKKVHKHTSSTPNPGKSPSPSRAKILTKKTSQTSISFQKADLRKGIFSNKQISCEKILERAPMLVKKHADAPVLALKPNKYLILSREYNIDKAMFKQKKVEIKDSEGFYIPEKPPLIHDKNNTLSSNR